MFRSIFVFFGQLSFYAFAFYQGDQTCFPLNLTINQSYGNYTNGTTIGDANQTDALNSGSPSCGVYGIGDT